MSETYKYDKYCWNCYKEVSLKIPKGMTTKTYLKKTKCPKCGCKNW